MQHRFVIPDLLLPSRQYAAKAIHPVMRSFHNPTMSPELAVFNRLRLLVPRLDMRFIATGFQTNFQPFSLAARLSTRLRCVPNGWWVLCSGRSGAIFSRSSSLNYHLLSAILRPQNLPLFTI